MVFSMNVIIYDVGNQFSHITLNSIALAVSSKVFESGVNTEIINNTIWNTAKLYKINE